MERIKFQVFGLRPEIAVRSLVINPIKQVEEVKKMVKVQFHLNPVLPISLIYQGKVLSDRDQFSCLGISPKDKIGVIILMTAG